MQNIQSKDSIFLLLIYSLLEAVLQYISLKFGYKRFLFSMEMFFAFLCISMNLRRLGWILFAVAITLEVMQAISSVFYLFNIAQVFDMLGFLFQARLDYLLKLGALICFSVLLFGTSAIYVRGHSGRAIYLTLVFALLMGYQWLISEKSQTFFTPSLSERSGLIFGSSIHMLNDSQSINGWNVMGGSPGEKTEFFPIRSPSAVNTFWGREPSASKVLLIVDEAWGLPKDRNLLDLQLESLKNNPRILNLTIKDVYARGATATGELRELCGLIPTKMNFRKMTAVDGVECLPQKLSSEGYQTLGIHGAEAKMYNRNNWWPMVGLKEQIFEEQLPNFGRLCYSFSGKCDRDILSVVNGWLKKEKIFVYWMSLNTHVPYDSRDILKFKKELCVESSGIGVSENLCNYQNLHAQFFDGLNMLANDESLRGVEVLVVGDHPPIFDDEVNRDAFVQDRVPALHFTIQ